MRRRPHHNNNGHRSTRRGRRSLEVEQMARRVFGRRVHRIADKLFIREKPHVVKCSDIKTSAGPRPAEHEREAA